MLIEAAHRQAGSLHEGCHPGPVQPSGADLTSGVLQDPLSRPRFVIRLVTHDYWIIYLILSILNLLIDGQSKAHPLTGPLARAHEVRELLIFRSRSASGPRFRRRTP